MIKVMCDDKIGKEERNLIKSLINGNCTFMAN